MNIDWHALRPLNGSRRDGFEELVAQLARSERPSGTRFVRKGSPDAGVECFAVFEDGSEWGWQAKCFDTLGRSQWAQLDESVRTALDRHPRLERYFVSIPLDLADPRVPEQEWAFDKWKTHVEKWSEWATDRSMSVQFVWWGSSKLIEVLSKPEHAGRVRFWFDKASFDPAWFEARLAEAIAGAGARYTPELHVDVPIARDFEAFLREPRFFDRIRDRAIDIRKELRALRSEWRRRRGEDDAERTTDTPIEVESARRTVEQAATEVLEALTSLEPSPSGPLTLRDLHTKSSTARQAASALAGALREWELELGRSSGSRRAMRGNEHALATRLWSALREAQMAVRSGASLANANHLIITGAAGTGKTHLVIDVVRRCVAGGAPAVAVLGNQLLSAEDPWSQILSGLDLPRTSATDFIGALEAAAQSRGTRALLVIDALNEGAGKKIWPEHLRSLLERISRSEWVSVALTIRSSYATLILGDPAPEGVVMVEHPGFGGRAFEAMTTFFEHFGLELPSTPLLAPEFNNPLFLKVLCQGLSNGGHKRLPRGFHGISDTFDLYLNAVNRTVAKSLDYYERKNLVREALYRTVDRLVAAGHDWLDAVEAEEVINELLPGRTHESSLFRAMLNEGILMEEHLRLSDGTHLDVVQVGYERLLDHLAVSRILGEVDDLEVALRPGGALADLPLKCHAGRLEALCVQVPERVGSELATLSPDASQRWEYPSAFEASLIWRHHDALGADGLELVTGMLGEQEGFSQLLEVVLTVATLPSHPLNADYLHDILSKMTMPDRDATWSIALHHGWRRGQALHRLIDWAWADHQFAGPSSETLLLAGTTLAWTLTCPNRFLRDRATKALVALYVGRPEDLHSLLQRFDGVDDMYVRERLMAVACGVALSSNHAEEIEALAQFVYDSVFSKKPPAHILLRDYARIVVDRAAALGATLDADFDRIRPPYPSVWPRIPAEGDIEHLRANWDKGSYSSGELEWSRNMIATSIFDDDFAYYVIGTNSRSNWLDLPMSEPRWRSAEERMSALQDGLDEEATSRWRDLEMAQRKRSDAFNSFYDRWLESQADPDAAIEALSQGDSSLVEEVEALAMEDERLDEAVRAVESSDAALMAALSSAQRTELELLRSGSVPKPPPFPLDRIQRYVLWRVFDLGWTIKRFGHFDRFEVSRDGRAAAKAERFGKKYQWLAFHEISALVADHYQYGEPRLSSQTGAAYEGPWQDGLRDIDPSCLVKAATGGSEWHGHKPCWWAPAVYDSWDNDMEAEEWVARATDMPPIPELLSVADESGDRWLNLDGYFNWQSPVPSGFERHETTRRDLWYLARAYLIRGNPDDFLEWAETITFTGRWMPEPPTVHEMFLGEHVWSPAAEFFSGPDYASPTWSRPRLGCPVELALSSLHYLHETGNHDCSTDEGYTLKLPSAALVQALNLNWSGRASDFVDARGLRQAFDPTVDEEGPGALLVRTAALEERLAEHGLSLCWAVIGEKRELGGGLDSPDRSVAYLSGAYALDGGALRGFLTASVEWPEDQRRREVATDAKRP